MAHRPHQHEKLGADGQPHGHHVMSAGSLLVILLVLVGFTVATVYTAKEWHLGIIGNASLAIAIATIKATLVCMFFMHLKYDNHFYTVAMLCCVCLLILFLGFSMLDLGTRSLIDPVRAKLVIPVPKDVVGKSRFHNENVAAGRILFANNCAVCHGDRGEGVSGLGNSLVEGKGADFVDHATLLQLVEFIREGRAANDPANHTGLAMPPLGGAAKLTDEQLMQLALFQKALLDTTHSDSHTPEPHHAPVGGTQTEPHPPQPGKH